MKFIRKILRGTCTCSCGSCRGLHGTGHCYIWGNGCRL